MPNSDIRRHLWRLSLAAVTLASCVGLSACGGGGGGGVSYSSSTPFKVGVASSDSNIPPTPDLPTASEVCSTVYANDSEVVNSTGELNPNADVSTSVVTAAAADPDQARIQAALDACGASVNAAVGTAIDTDDAAAVTAEKAAGDTIISGESSYDLAQSKYIPTQHVVKLAVSDTGGGNAFITGPLTLPSGVTLWVSKGTYLLATRDVTAYNIPSKERYCGNEMFRATSSGSEKSGATSDCLSLITSEYGVNEGIVGQGVIDGRAYMPLVTSDQYYPMLHSDLTCSNTYAAYLSSPEQQAPDGTACDDGGTVVDSASAARNMSFWDLSWLGNLVESGNTSDAHQSVPRMISLSDIKNFTMYDITLSNSANSHVVPAGVDGFYVYGVKIITPSTAAYQSPEGNGNPLYTGAALSVDDVKNTDGFDPESNSKAECHKLITGSSSEGSANVCFDGFLKNNVYAYNYISDGDDDIAFKGEHNPAPAGSSEYGIDGNLDVNPNQAYGIIIAHNHFYAGHGVSVGSQTNSGVENIQVYDNSFEGGEEGLRIKSDFSVGGVVRNITYNDICMKDITENALLFTPYYSTPTIPSTPLIPDFYGISVNNTEIEGASGNIFQGVQANSFGLGNAQYPLQISLNNVVAEDPSDMTVTASDADITVSGVNLPIYASTDNRVTVNGLISQAVDPSRVVDCSNAFVDFPSTLFPGGSGWQP